jgi:DNA repair protein RecN (Recombination protein N)
MPGARVVHACDPDDVAAERAQLALAANPGAEPLPLARVASGGELARAMLAIRLVLLGSDTSPMTLVFDEVDAGIGGRVAEMVGSLLAELGRHHQVLCVTHLPQVAAFARHQLRVSKEAGAGGTRATVEPLDAAGRVEEIARMLGGARITETTRRHAEEMLGGGTAAARGGKSRAAGRAR